MSAAITAPAITACCRSDLARAVAVEVVACTGSTNADLMARLASTAVAGADVAATGIPARTAAVDRPTLRVALCQTAGRGRAGRAWLSDDASLTFSLAWSFAQPLTALVGLPLAVGVAVAEVLRARGTDVLLKWPNDLLCEGRKLGGILIEATRHAGAAAPASWAVIGIGINLLPQSAAPEPGGATAPARAVVPDQATAPARAAVPDQATAPAGAAVPDQATVPSPGGLGIAALPATDRNLLLAQLLDALSASLTLFSSEGFAPFVARWNALHAHAGRTVSIIDRGSVLHSGRARGVDTLGRLQLDTAQGMVAVLAGDVSLRPVEEGA